MGVGDWVLGVGERFSFHIVTFWTNFDNSLSTLDLGHGGADSPLLAASPRRRGGCRVSLPGAGPGGARSRPGRDLQPAGRGGGPPCGGLAPASGGAGPRGGATRAIPPGPIHRLAGAPDRTAVPAPLSARGGGAGGQKLP